MHQDSSRKGWPFLQEWGKCALQNFNMVKDGSTFVNQKTWNSFRQGKTLAVIQLSAAKETKIFAERQIEDKL